MLARRLVAVAVLLGFSLSAQIACAEDQIYRFKDDPLAGQGLDGKTAVIKVNGKRPITRLIRPRVSFVPVLLKSVEKI